MPYRAKTHKTPRLNAPCHQPPRPSATQRGYGTAWQRLRKAFLRQRPWCADPFGHHAQDGRRAVLAEHVDHVIPLAAGGTSGEENLQGLCATCHRRKTVLHDGGFGRARKTATR